MNAPARITLAGLSALVLIASHAVYRAWPRWYGTELYLPAAVYPVDPTSLGYVRVDVAAERLRLGVPGGLGEQQTKLFQSVRGIGGVSRGNVFVQLEPDQSLWPHGPVAMRPVSVSETRVAGATNLAGHVTRVDEAGRVWLTFGSHQLPVPPDVVTRAKPLEVIREPNRSPAAKSRPPDPGTFAIFRVLPSGRAAIAGLIVAGRRVD